MTKAERLERVETLQNLLLARATDGGGDESRYQPLRAALVADPDVAPRLPRFVRTCRDLSQFRNFMQQKFRHYHERREFIVGEFGPLFEVLERRGSSPADQAVSDVLEQLDTEHVRQLWSRALDRRLDDPEGAITLARTLIETVCKHILDDLGRQYDDSADLPRLYRRTAEVLNIAPSQHSEEIFKRILGGCTSVVEGLGSLRNCLSDAHGKGRLPIRPAPRHAELAVNLAGTVALFLVGTWLARMETRSDA